METSRDERPSGEEAEGVGWDTGAEEGAREGREETKTAEKVTGWAWERRREDDARGEEEAKA